jgi:hypothetical protein
LGVASIVLLLAGLAAATTGWMIYRAEAPAVSAARPTGDQATTPHLDGEQQAVVLSPTTDLSPISKAMAECDAEAAKAPDQLYFVLLPLMLSKGAVNDWRSHALQEGGGFLWLNSKDALDGLRDGKLAVRDGRYTFSVLDPASGQTYSWRSVTRIAKLSRPAPKEMKSFKLGLDFSAAQTGAPWSNEFRRNPGSCYWVSALAQQ